MKKIRKDNYLDKEIEDCHVSHKFHKEWLDNIKRKSSELGSWDDSWDEIFTRLEKEASSRLSWLEKKKEDNSKIWSAKRIQEELNEAIKKQKQTL